MRISLFAVIISVHYVVAKHHRYHPMSADLLRKLDDLALPEEVRSTVDGSPPPPNVCQDGDCHHGGVCIDGMGCNCQPGFNGHSCENYDKDDLLKNHYNSTEGARKCTEMDQGSQSCSEQGFICPWVDCEPCLPCQEKEKTMFKSGDLKGCIMEEKCGPTSVIKGEECDCDSQKVVMPSSKAEEKGCEVETCVMCPPPPPPIDACHEVIEEKPPCGCATYKQIPKQELDTFTQHKKCGDKCAKIGLVDGQCEVICVDFTKEGECDQDCQEAVETKDIKTCTAQVTCIDLSAAKIAEKNDQCVSKPFGDGAFHGDNCGCPINEEYQLNKHQCPDTLHLTCKTKSCEAFKTKECPHYKIATHCSAEEQARCPEKCTKPLAVDCSCPDPIENCPEGSELGWKPCPLSQEECANDTKCCDKICPEEGSKDGKRRERTCTKESCEVCSDMDGAQLKEGEKWLNLQHCNSDERCCIRCRPAEEVYTCPTSWSQGKKARCECPDA